MTENMTTPEPAEGSAPEPARNVYSPAKAEVEPLGRRYRVPDTDTQLDPQEAETLLKQLSSDALADVNHPYLSGRHPLHDDYVEYASALHDQASEGKETPGEKMSREAFEFQEQKQQERIARGERLVDDLQKKGFDHIDVPGDVKEWQLAVWQMQGMVSDRNFTQLASQLDKETRLLSLSAETQAQLSVVQNPELPDKLRAQVAERILEEIYEARKKRGY